MKRYIFARKIPYERNGDRGITKCPFGGAIENGLFRHGIVWTGAMVGGHACSNCLFNKDTLWEYVLCHRKE